MNEASRARRRTFDQHLDRAIRQFEQLQDRRDRTDAIDVVGGRIVLGRVLLRHQQDLLVVLHHGFKRANRFLAADEEWHDHVREHNDVAQRQHGQRIADLGRRFLNGHSRTSFKDSQKRDSPDHGTRAS